MDMKGRVAQRITRLTTDQKIAGSNPAEIETIFRNFIYFLAIESKRLAPPGGLEPPTFRLTAERASRLRHGGIYLYFAIVYIQIFRFYVKSIISLLKFLIMKYYPKSNF